MPFPRLNPNKNVKLGNRSGVPLAGGVLRFERLGTRDNNATSQRLELFEARVRWKDMLPKANIRIVSILYARLII